MSFSVIALRAVHHNFHIDIPRADNRFVNLLDSTGDAVLLNETLSDSDTTLTLDNTANLYVNSIIRINDEKMIVTGVTNSTTINVERGSFETKAVAHADDSEVFMTHNHNIIEVKYEVDVTSLDKESTITLFIVADHFFSKQTFTSSQSATTLTKAFPSGTKDVTIGIAFLCSNATSGGTAVNNSSVKIYDINVIMSRDFKEPPRELYLASDGLKHGRTDDPLNGATITEIHDAHLDLLHRFSGENTGTANISNWNQLNSDKDWNIRYWKNKPVDLQGELERFQYEGGFIFRYKHDGSPQYIHIKDTYTSSNYTLTKHDINNVKVTPSSLSNILSAMDINYQKHPAENRYLTAVSSSNSTTRINYNFQEKENISEVSLHAYVSPTIPTAPATSPNDDFYSYYNNISGSPKLIITGDIVNSKFYNIEVGDVVNFEDRPFEFFNTSDVADDLFWDSSSEDWEDTDDLWSTGTGDDKYFMITSLTRKIGILSFTAREIA